jgi:hypothetical protein
MADLTSLWHFNRPKLAQKFAKRLIQHERVAMFGPRQTGKTTLLREEVMPALETAGLLPIYVECWADKGNPLQSINYALAKALEALTLSPGKRGQRLAKTPVRKIGAVGLSIEVGEVAHRKIPDNPYLAFDALLTSLLDASGKDLVLVFDEFQAIAQAKDSDAIAAALRSALTQVSSRVGVVFSGSSQHLLLEMFSRAQTPLYNFANTEPYPLLKEDFIGHVAKKATDATQRDFNQAIAMRVLESVGHQPAPFPERREQRHEQARLDGGSWPEGDARPEGHQQVVFCLAWAHGPAAHDASHRSRGRVVDVGADVETGGIGPGAAQGPGVKPEPRDGDFDRQGLGGTRTQFKALPHQ